MCASLSVIDCFYNAVLLVWRLTSALQMLLQIAEHRGHSQGLCCLLSVVNTHGNTVYTETAALSTDPSATQISSESHPSTDCSLQWALNESQVILLSLPSPGVQVIMVSPRLRSNRVQNLNGSGSLTPQHRGDGGLPCLGHV